MHVLVDRESLILIHQTHQKAQKSLGAAGGCANQGRHQERLGEDDCERHVSVVAGASCRETARSQRPIHLKVYGQSLRDPQSAVDVQHLELPERKLPQHGHWDRWDRECLLINRVIGL